MFWTVLSVIKRKLIGIKTTVSLNESLKTGSSILSYTGKCLKLWGQNFSQIRNHKKVYLVEVTCQNRKLLVELLAKEMAESVMRMRSER